MCAKLDHLSHFKDYKLGYLDFSRQETGAESVAMATTVWVIPVSCHNGLGYEHLALNHETFWQQSLERIC